MKLVDKNITVAELAEMSKKMHGKLVKVVVDLEKEIMLVDAGMHFDLELVFLEEYESQQKNLWGINLHPGSYGTDTFVEFDSMINFRVSDENPSRGVLDKNVQKQIIKVVDRLVTK